MPSSYPKQFNESSMLISTSNLYRNPNTKKPLPASFQPGPYDVICARGKQAFDHMGNKRFRHLVKIHQENYAAAVCKYQKSKIVSHIVNTVRQLSPEGGFVKLIKGVWHEVGDRAAKEKIGQTFRDLLHTKYSSSTKAKARARIQQRIEEYESENAQHSSLSGQESSDGSSDDDSVDKGLYPSFAEERKPPSRIEIVMISEPKQKQPEEPGNLFSGTIRAFQDETKPETPVQATSAPASDMLEPLSFDDDSIGEIDYLVEADLLRRASSNFEADMKAFAEMMGVGV